MMFKGLQQNYYPKRSENIQKDFPNISDELVNLMINMANSDEKFDMIRDPKTFLDKEFSKVSNFQNLNTMLNADLSQKELTKIYNILQYRFYSELTEFGFESLEIRKLNSQAILLAQIKLWSNYNCKTIFCLSYPYLMQKTIVNH